MNPHFLFNGLHSSPEAGGLRIVVRPTGPWLEMSVRDDGKGVPSAEVEQLFFAERPRVHALVLLRRRLRGLFGRSFQLEVRSEIGEGTTVNIRIPLQKRSEVPLNCREAIASDRCERFEHRLGDVGSNPQAMERLADLYPFCHKIVRHLEALS
jgi:hypothetical protein